MKTLYLVMGGSGEYSNYGNWPIVVYDNAEEANAHKDKANAWQGDDPERRRLNSPWDVKERDRDYDDPPGYFVWKIEQYDSIKEWALLKASGHK